MNLDAFDHNQKTDSGANIATQLQTIGVPDHKMLVVKAMSTNTETIFVGDSDVTLTNGFELQTGEAVKLLVTNVNQVWIRSTSGSQSVCWITETLH